MRITPLILVMCLSLGCAAKSPRAMTMDPPDDMSAPDAMVMEDAAADTMIPPGTACSEMDPRAVPVELSVLPDAGEKPFVDVINSATTSLRVMVYMMGYGGILDAINAKASAGVDVKVILDGQTQIDVNTKYKTALEAAGAEVRWSDPQFSYMHAKYILADGAVAIISTGNYSKSFLLKERNLAATDRDPQDTADLARIFDADWMKKSPDLACTRLLVSPVNAKDRIVSLIKGAQKSVFVESMQLADYSVRGALIERHKAGVDVRIVVANPSWIDANADAGALMKANGIAIRWLESPSVHVKSILVDDVRGFMGSENLSSTSLTKNREVGLVLSEPPAVASMRTTMEADWQKATAF
jgi:cardiolipin synthase A/B